MDRRRAIAIAVGGMVGATSRWAVLAWSPSRSGFPWAVFAINVGGSAILGAVLAEQWRHPSQRLALHDGVGIGFCGGLTTFSTFAVEVAEFQRSHRPVLAAIYLLASIAAGLGAAVIGGALMRRSQALSLPLEEDP